MRNRGYIEFETLDKPCWSYLRNIKTAKLFLQTLSHIIYPYISQRKNLAKQWDSPNTGIFYSKDVASGIICRFVITIQDSLLTVSSIEGLKVQGHFVTGITNYRDQVLQTSYHMLKKLIARDLMFRDQQSQKCNVTRIQCLEMKYL
jgi:hypothetical protein